MPGNRENQKSILLSEQENFNFIKNLSESANVF